MAKLGVANGHVGWAFPKKKINQNLTEIWLFYAWKRSAAQKCAICIHVWHHPIVGAHEWLNHGRKMMLSWSSFMAPHRPWFNHEMIARPAPRAMTCELTSLSMMFRLVVHILWDPIWIMMCHNVNQAQGPDVVKPGIIMGGSVGHVVDVSFVYDPFGGVLGGGSGLEKGSSPDAFGGGLHVCGAKDLSPKILSSLKWGVIIRESPELFA
jgi:hypothetical protein